MQKNIKLQRLISMYGNKFTYVLIISIFICIFTSFAQENYIKSTFSLGTKTQKIEILDKILYQRDFTAVPEVIKLLNDPSVNVRILASKILYVMGDSSFTASYEQEMHDPYWQVRLYGIKSLVKWGRGDKILSDFKKGLDDSYWQVRFWSAVGFEKFGNAGSLNPLISHLNDKNTEIKIAILRALQHILSQDIGKYDFKKLSPDTLSIFSTLSQSKNKEIQINTIWALEETNDPRVVPDIVNLLNSKWTNVKIQAVWALEQMKTTTGFTNLTKLLAEPSVKLKIETIKTLVRLNATGAVDALILKLGDPDKNVRVYALWGLEKFNNDSSYPAIVNALSDHSEIVKETAYQTILSLKNPDFVPLLENVVSSPETPVYAKILSLRLLGKIGTGETNEFFKSLRGNPQPQVREHLLRAWSSLNPSDTDFLEYLSYESRMDNDYLVRKDARNILENINSGLEEEITSSENSKRTRAIEKLSLLKRSSEISGSIREMLISPYPDVRDAGLKFITYQPESSSYTLIKDCLSSSSEETKRLALMAAGKTRVPGAVSLISPYLNSPDTYLKITAAYSLALLGNRDGVFVARDNLFNPDVRIQLLAIKTVSLLNDKASSPKLLQTLQSSNLEVKLNSACALAKTGVKKGLYALVDLSQKDTEPVRTQARLCLYSRDVLNNFRYTIPGIKQKIYTLKEGIREIAHKQITAEKFSVPPAMDANNNETPWSDMAASDTFIYIGNERVPSEVQTKVFAGYDSKNLYILAVCEDLQADTLNYNSQDFFTVAINPANSNSRWYQFTVQPTNIIRYAYIWRLYSYKNKNSMYRKWTSSWKSVTSIKSDKWIVEISIPLKDIHGKIVQGSYWGINFQRTSDHLPDVTWTGKIDNPYQFGRIKFDGDNS
ncbi:MAG: HEAT repeat domain-containing protein [Candidatus Omnitrophica bacterium]|nr:HEAT repeat domain-containing protein [Candidatus Omnitrophota bacterium]